MKKDTKQSTKPKQKEDTKKRELIEISITSKKSEKPKEQVIIVDEVDLSK